MAISIRDWDDKPRLVRAGEYWWVAIGNDDRFDFDSDHSRTKFVIVQRDVLVTERQVPCWVCTRYDDISDQWVRLGLNAVVSVQRRDDVDCEVVVDVTKPISLPGAWFQEASNRAELRGAIEADATIGCLIQQAHVMRAVSPALRPE